MSCDRCQCLEEGGSILQFYVSLNLRPEKSTFLQTGHGILNDERSTFPLENRQVSLSDSQS